MTDLRTRIIAVLNVHGVKLDDSRCDCGRDCFDRTCESLSDYVEHVADAVIRDVLTPEFLADLVIAAVQKAADDE